MLGGREIMSYDMIYSDISSLFNLLRISRDSVCVGGGCFDLRSNIPEKRQFQMRNLQKGSAEPAALYVGLFERGPLLGPDKTM